MDQIITNIFIHKWNFDNIKEIKKNGLFMPKKKKITKQINKINAIIFMDFLLFLHEISLNNISYWPQECYVSLFLLSLCYVNSSMINLWVLVSSIDKVFDG